MDFSGGLGVLILVAVIGLGGLLVAGAAIAWRAGRARVAWAFLGGALSLGVLHLIAVAGVSLATPARTLPPGQVKHFCGFYLDCHLGASVDSARAVASIGAGGRERWARGRYWIVTIRVSSDARRATLTPYGLEATMVDEHGRRFARDRAAERALLGGAAAQPLEQPLGAGESYTRTLVFDLPAASARPALEVRERGFPDELIETVLIGDEDSFLHRPTRLSVVR